MRTPPPSSPQPPTLSDRKPAASGEDAALQAAVARMQILLPHQDRPDMTTALLEWLVLAPVICHLSQSQVTAGVPGLKSVAVAGGACIRPELGQA